MVPEIKAQWLADLRSGEYKKGKGYLKHRNALGQIEYCCLGVLCEQAAKAGIISAAIESVDGYFYFGSDQFILPYAVMEWAGLEMANPGLWQVQGPAYVGPLTLSMANDHSGRGDEEPERSFSEIADLIEQYL